jgi:tRNA pseudouridine55 synthase
VTTGVDGLLIIDKPEGPTSHDVVARLRRLLHESRIGHTGTLDPMATGVLPLVLGRATRLAQFLTSDTKRYEAVVQLGQATDTYDRLGEPTSTRDVAVTREGIGAALDRFRGDITQAPPPYSAKKIGGVSAHRLARRGQAVAPAPVQVAVHRLDLVDVDLTTHRLTLDVTSSAGFYVRSLAHDLGLTLGCGAHLAALRRTESGEWTLAHAVPLADCEHHPDTARERVMPMTRLLTSWPAVVVTGEGERRVGHGQLLRPEDVEAGEFPPGARLRLLNGAGALLGIADRRSDGFLHPGLVLV